jgi:L-threonylcarbamoyladenylate synthase
MASTYDCSVDAELTTGLRFAQGAIGRGELVVIPTDTVYGVAADAFQPAAIARLLEAKGRDRSAPPPVLIPGIPTLDALADGVPEEVRKLVDAFWPGGLTVILPFRTSLAWDIGETRGTVALRMPNNAIALDLLSETGPLAVSSANLTGEPAALTAIDAKRMLGDAVSVYLDAGPAGAGYPEDLRLLGSTIVDATALLREGGKLRIARSGVIPDGDIWRVAGVAA